jgi:hypothetical protein
LPKQPCPKKIVQIKIKSLEGGHFAIFIRVEVLLRFLKNGSFWATTWEVKIKKSVNLCSY